MDIEDVRDPYSRLSSPTIGRLGRVGAIGKLGEKSGRIGVTLPPNGHIRDIEACGIAGLINIDGEREGGRRVVDMITTMTDRENGLGAGYACYGLFPDMADHYCIQLLLDDEEAKDKVEEHFKGVGKIIKDEKVFTRPVKGMKGPYPLVWRFFMEIPKKVVQASPNIENEDDYVVDVVMHVNEKIDGAFCMSSGKNMAVFKGNGWSYEIPEFYDLGSDRYKGYMWLSHSRFPTNTPGWWGGAHPFNILGWSLCHNGEITSYGTNKRYVEMGGYKCTLLTDSEVVTYLWDLLCRRHGLPKLIACMAMAPRYYDEILRLPEDQARMMKVLRMTYGRAMINGPFSILVGTDRPTPAMIALTDRKKLRPMIAALSDDGNTVFASSEECAMRRIGNIGEVWAPHTGNPVIIELHKGLVWKGTEEPFEGKKLKLEV
ncbi:MAG: glutamine amidotransferase family protein [Halobacteriota archaeon]|nr:glutamine amidotransferase family protein [Halobacteriota archaeon]